MSEKIIKSFHLKEIARPIVIEPPKMEFQQEKVEENDEEKRPSGPSAEELQKILDDKTAEAEEKYKEIIKKAEEDSTLIRREAENYAFDQVKKMDEEINNKLKETTLKTRKIEEEAKEKANLFLQEAQKEADKVRKEAEQAGFEQGREHGYQKGMEEVNRLVAVIHKISGDLIQKREKILSETERELVELVMLISSKVIKTISETQKRVVYDNIIAALSKLKGRAEVTIRVNPADMMTVTKHKQAFMETVEGVENIRILEDPNVDIGGCIVNSEFGAIDARVSTQLAEIEDAIKKLSPLKNEDMQ